MRALYIHFVIAVLSVAGLACSAKEPGAAETSVASADGPDAGNTPSPVDSRPGPSSTPSADERDAAVDAGPAVDCGAFPAITDLASAGPFGAIGTAEGPNCTIVRPAKVGLGGVRHPVIVWGNGTDALEALYEPGLELWASHGFIVAASNVLNGQGSGAPMLACLDYVMKKDAGSVCERAGAAGHSQGGGGALMAGRDPRIVATAPLQPYTAQGYGGFDRASFTSQIGPMLLLSGSLDDNAVPSIHQKPVFDATNVPVFWATLQGGDHYTVAALGLTNYRERMLAWFRLQLTGDESFRAMFYGPSCGLCTDTKWAVQRRNFP